MLMSKKMNTGNLKLEQAYELPTAGGWHSGIGRLAMAARSRRYAGLGSQIQSFNSLILVSEFPALITREFAQKRL
jgi:hypothetical protein